MQIQLFQVDAFSDQVFSGNPACVCPLQRWLPDDILLKIAAENAVAETAFFIPEGEGFSIRWFTPDIEMDLCGHATLASAHVISRHLGYRGAVIPFTSRSGRLAVQVADSWLTLDFPSRPPLPCQPPDEVLLGFSPRPLAVFKARDYLLVYEDEDTVRQMVPNQAVLNQINLNPGGIIITAPGREVDFVSRFFTPQATLFEDPVTGSAHCTLIPYWSERLGKTSLTARQVSQRGGYLICRQQGERVFISGQAVTYFEGMLTFSSG